MTNETSKRVRQGPVADDWFSNVDVVDGEISVPTKRKNSATATRELPNQIGSIGQRLVALFIPSSRTRLVFTLSLMLALPVAFDFVHQVLQNFDDKFDRVIDAFGFGFLAAFMSFSLGAVVCGKFSFWERAVVLAAAAVATIAHLTYGIQRAASRTDAVGIQYECLTFLTALVFIWVATLVGVSAIAIFIRSRQETVLKFFSRARLFLITGLAVLAISLVNLQSSIEFPSIELNAVDVKNFSVRSWWWLPTLFGLTAAVIPIFLINYSRSLLWLTLWIGFGVLLAFVIFNLGTNETRWNPGHHLNLAASYSVGLLIAVFGTFRNRYRPVVAATAGSWLWAILMNCPVWFAGIAMIVTSQRYYIPAIYDERAGFQWDLAGDLAKIRGYARINCKQRNIWLDFTNNRNQQDVAIAPLTAVTQLNLTLRGVDESLNLDFLSASNVSLYLYDSNVTMDQLEHINISNLVLHNTSVARSQEPKGLSASTIRFQQVQPGTFANVIQNLDDQSILSDVHVRSNELGDEDWASACKLAETTPVYLAVQVAAKPRANFDSIAEKLHELTDQSQLTIYANFAPVNSEMAENYWRNALLFCGANVDIQTYQYPTLPSANGLSFFDSLYLNRKRIFDYSGLGIAELTNEVQSAESLREKHLLYSSRDDGVDDALYLPQLVWSDPAIFRLVTQMRCLSLEDRWRLGTQSKTKEEPIDELADNVKFAAEELYLGDELYLLAFLNRFPNLETLQVRWPFGTVSTDALNQLGKGIEASPKLKKFIWEGGVYTRVLESLQKCTSLEELVLSETDVANFGLDNIKKFLPKTKITVVDRDLSGPNGLVPKHFLDHHERVIERLRAKATAEIKKLKKSPSGSQSK